MQFSRSLKDCIRTTVLRGPRYTISVCWMLGGGVRDWLSLLGMGIIQDITWPRGYPRDPNSPM